MLCRSNQHDPVPTEIRRPGQRQDQGQNPLTFKEESNRNKNITSAILPHSTLKDDFCSVQSQNFLLLNEQEMNQNAKSLLCAVFARLSIVDLIVPLILPLFTSIVVNYISYLNI